LIELNEAPRKRGIRVVVFHVHGLQKEPRSLSAAHRKKVLPPVNKKSTPDF
jgi:hypothetical protein